MSFPTIILFLLNDESLHYHNAGDQCYWVFLRANAAIIDTINVSNDNNYIIYYIIIFCYDIVVILRDSLGLLCFSTICLY